MFDSIFATVTTYFSETVEVFFQWGSYILLIVLWYLLLPYIWDVIKQYQRIFVWFVVVTLAFVLLSPYLNFLLYHLNIWIALALSPLVTAWSVWIIVKFIVAVLLLIIGRIIYGLVSNK